jgi:hypothetical protein
MCGDFRPALTIDDDRAARAGLIIKSLQPVREVIIAPYRYGLMRYIQSLGGSTKSFTLMEMKQRHGSLENPGW